jgi:hypothetical protein
MNDFKPDHRGYAIFFGTLSRTGGPFQGNYSVKEVSAPYKTVLRGEVDRSHATHEEAATAGYAAAVAAIDNMLDMS